MSLNDIVLRNYELLKESATNEMLASPEMWVAMFDFNEKTYGIMGDGAMTSNGDYLTMQCTHNQIH